MNKVIVIHCDRCDSDHVSDELVPIPMVVPTVEHITMTKNSERNVHGVMMATMTHQIRYRRMECHNCGFMVQYTNENVVSFNEGPNYKVICYGDSLKQHINKDSDNHGKAYLPFERLEDLGVPREPVLSQAILEIAREDGAPIIKKDGNFILDSGYEWDVRPNIARQILFEWVKRNA